MVSADGRYAITYNGEIYNYLEIRDKLNKEGCKFNTSTDTEVLLNAYIAWGERCVDFFNGTWAFAIVDIKENKLIVSRDRIGVKPLYFYKDDSKLLWASEIKAILSAIGNTPRPETGAVSDFLNYSLVDHSSLSFYKGVEAFCPGTISSYSIDSCRLLSSHKFWSASDIQNKYNFTSFSEACDLFRETFRDSVRLRLRSDVPLGASLSGGIDSSAVVCMISELLGSTSLSLNTFTCVPEEDSISEKPWADIVSNSVGSCQHEVKLPLDTDIKKLLDSMQSVQDQPFTSSSILAQQLIMQEASSLGIKVMLDGQGADEAFAGYRKYVATSVFEALRNRRSPVALARHLFFVLLYGDTGLFSLGNAQRYLPALLRHRSADLVPCYLPGLMTNQITSSIYQGDIRRVQEADVMHYSLPSLLRYNDHNTMSCSIEARNPFLDYRLVELGLQLPPNYKILRGKTKAILRESFKQLVPRQVLDRRNKMGFSFTQENLMRRYLDNGIKEMLQQTSRVAEYLNPKLLCKLRDAWLSGKHLSKQHEALLFRIYILESWLVKSYG
jgi:asparagine synthase (glutamine-hydrolysing)